MRVLVLGGSRFNGLALVERLVADGHDVSVFNRGVTPAVLPRGVERLTGDRRDASALAACLRTRDFDAVHDSSGYEVADVARAVEVLRDRVGHYVFASSAAVYAPQRDDNPIAEEHPTSRDERNVYGQNKLACERWLLAEHAESGFPASITRYPMVYGPRNPSPHRETLLFRRLCESRPIAIPGDGSTLSHPSYVHDQARCLATMMGNERTFGRVYNLASQQPYSDDGYVDTLAGIAGVAVDKVHLAPELADEAFRSLMYPLLPRQGIGFVDWRKSTVFSTARFEADVGTGQTSSLEEGMTTTWEWYRSEGDGPWSAVDLAPEQSLIERARSR